MAESAADHEARRSVEEFVDFYRIARLALRALRCHRHGPPGIKGIEQDLEAVCGDALELYERISPEAEKPKA